MKLRESLRTRLRAARAEADKLFELVIAGSLYQRPIPERHRLIFYLGHLKAFEPFSFYPGYSANFFDGNHYVTKGGSSRTAATLLRRTFRNWFQSHYPYTYTAFRLVDSEV